MIDTVFQDDPASIPAVKALYAKAKIVVEPEMDEETCLLLQEMAISDQVNSADLKAYQDDLKKAQVNALNRKRKDMEEKVKADKEAKKKRAKLLKEKKLTYHNPYIFLHFSFKEGLNKKDRNP